MADTVLLITSAGELIQDDMLNGSTIGSAVQFVAASDSTGSVLDKFNKLDACFQFDDQQTVTVSLTFTNGQSQSINIADIRKSLFNSVGIYVNLTDDTTADGDLYEYLATNTVVLSSGGKTLADYGITDAYTKAETYSKAEVDAKIPTKVSQLQNDAGYLTQHQDISGKADKSYVDELVGDIESQLQQV